LPQPDEPDPHHRRPAPRLSHSSRKLSQRASSGGQIAPKRPADRQASRRDRRSLARRDAIIQM